MAEFLNTHGINLAIDNIIGKAKTYIYIISPYLKINEGFRNELEYMDAFKLDIRIIYGKVDLKPEEIEWLEERKSIRVSFCKNLHAKCYMNEEMALISSMNMYEYSMINNVEMGILVNRKDDPEIFEDILRTVQKLVRTSDEVQLSVKKVEPVEDIKENVSETMDIVMFDGHDKPLGFCIRCGDFIDFDLKKPYCEKDFKNWNRWKNPNYIEEKGCCHRCGVKVKTSMNNPLCKDCKNIKVKGRNDSG